MNPDVELLQFLFTAGILHRVDDTTYRSTDSPVSATGKRRKLTATVVRNPLDNTIVSVQFDVTVTGIRTLKSRNPHRGAVRL